jgi:hypothetical protein
MSLDLYEEIKHIQFYFGPDVELFDLQNSLEHIEAILAVVIRSQMVIEPAIRKLKVEIHRRRADPDDINRLYSKVLCNVSNSLKFTESIGCPISKHLEVDLLRKLQTKIGFVKERLDHVSAEISKFNLDYEKAVDRMLILNQTIADTLQYVKDTLNKNITEYYDKK